jgi:hypothetical protein
MNVQRLFINGFIIFFGIGIYFLAMDFLGLSNLFYLRVLNLFIVIYGVNRTISQNRLSGVMGYNTNLLSAIITSMIGAVLSVSSLLAYIYFIKSGEVYLKTLSEGFLFGGGELSIYQYCIGLLFESVASSIIISFCLMQFWKGKVETINKVD